MFRAIDETTAESSENQFVTRLMKVPVGKKLPQLDEKVLSHFWTEAHNKPFFELQESEEVQELMQAEDEEPEKEQEIFENVQPKPASFELLQQLKSKFTGLAP